MLTECRKGVQAEKIEIYKDEKKKKKRRKKKDDWYSGISDREKWMKEIRRCVFFCVCEGSVCF